MGVFQFNSTATDTLWGAAINARNFTGEALPVMYLSNYTDLLSNNTEPNKQAQNPFPFFPKAVLVLFSTWPAMQWSHLLCKEQSHERFQSSAQGCSPSSTPGQSWGNAPNLSDQSPPTELQSLAPTKAAMAGTDVFDVSATHVIRSALCNRLPFRLT